MVNIKDDIKTLPPVNYNSALTPDQDGAEVLSYSKLGKEITEQERFLSERWENFNDSEPGSLEETKNGIQLAQAYLLKTALDGLGASNAKSRELWQRRFTDASVELFGAPKEQIVAELAYGIHENLSSFRGNTIVDQDRLEKVLDVYDRIRVPDDSEISTTPELSEKTKSELRQYLEQKYGYVLEIADKLPERQHSPAEMVKIFERAILLLSKEDNPKWGVWSVELADQSGISIRNETQTVRVGERRNSAYPEEIKKLLAHEILVHANRMTQGLCQVEDIFHEPIQGYSEFEEGFGIVAEYLVSGKLPAKAIDRYLDISLALGQNNLRLTRNELFDFAFDRAIVFSEIAGKKIDKGMLEREVWTHIDRIFRGGDGEEKDQAIYTRYTYYYEGFMRTIDFINEWVTNGKSVGAVMDYLLQAKFDPTDPLHKKLVKEKGLISSL